MVRYAIRCTPGGLLKDDSTGNIIYFNSLAEAEAEAQRLTALARDDPRVLEIDFTPEPEGATP